MHYNNFLFCRRRRAFTLVELLLVISTIGLLMSILLSSLGLARSRAKAMACMSNLRQIGFAVCMYVGDYGGYLPPAYEPSNATHWWGQKLSDGIDHTKGFVWPYLQGELKKKSVYECPAQRYGSYKLQAKPPGEPDDPKWITSTYGYNGYYLSPEKSAWWWNIHRRPWQKITTVMKPAEVFAFADTLLDRDVTGGQPNVENNALLDPPYLYSSNGWIKNGFPTTCFRHNERTNVIFVDGHCAAMGLEDGEYTHPRSKVGSVGKKNAPHYVPDCQRWP
jgi:prepilin-type processing-associated H-X9-DG protein